jgi:hypothetical protein
MRKLKHLPVKDWPEADRDAFRASPEVSEQHYNLARSVGASRRYAAHLARRRARLRPAQGTEV